MAKSLLFIPDISGFTKFVQTTEVEHSQHVISELLEILINANTQDLKLAEVEGDALFFYKENNIPSQEKLLAQIETMFTAFYSHLELLEKHRICPCNACATAPQLDLKIVIHCGELQFLNVQGNHKPFGNSVIESHRLLKNSINSNRYALLTSELSNYIGLPSNYNSKLFNFNKSADSYDGKDISYIFSEIDKPSLTLNPFKSPLVNDLPAKPNLSFEYRFNISSNQLLEYISNYKYRHYWVKGVDAFEYNETEVTRLGTEHVCVINQKHLDFTTVTKPALPGQLVYGEFTTSPRIVDELYQFYTIEPITESHSKVVVETYWKVKSVFKKLIVATLVKKQFIKNSVTSMTNLKEFTEN